MEFFDSLFHILFIAKLNSAVQMQTQKGRWKCLLHWPPTPNKLKNCTTINICLIGYLIFYRWVSFFFCVCVLPLWVSELIKINDLFVINIINLCTLERGSKRKNIYCCIWNFHKHILLFEKGLIKLFCFMYNSWNFLCLPVYCSQKMTERHTIKCWHLISSL